MDEMAAAAWAWELQCRDPTVGVVFQAERPAGRIAHVAEPSTFVVVVLHRVVAAGALGPDQLGRGGVRDAREGVAIAVLVDDGVRARLVFSRPTAAAKC